MAARTSGAFVLDVRNNWPEEVPQRAVSMRKYERK
jgi:hypothetical protein